jgi:hypothetical protein
LATHRAASSAFDRVSTDSLPRSTQQLTRRLLPPSLRIKSALVTDGSAPATSNRLALWSLTTSTPCSIRPLPPVMTTAASVIAALRWQACRA